MAQIDRQGLFRGLVRDHAVNLTSQQKLPQFVATLAATEMWDEVGEVWLPWTEYGQMITGYFVLVFLDGNGDVAQCLNYEQVMRATGWDGVSFAGLEAMNLKEHSVQFRVQPDTYDGKTSLKVCWIDKVDAEIGLRKLSADDLSKLDVQFGGMFAPKAKPAGAPAPKTKPDKPAKKLAEELDEVAAPTTAPKKKAPPKIGKPPKPKVPAVDEPSTACTMEEAWAACETVNEELKDSAVPEEVLVDYWQTRAVEIAEDVGENGSGVTQEEWAKIRNAVIADLGDIPF